MKLRVEQKKEEGADLFAMRAWAKGMPLMDNLQMEAAARWIWNITLDTIAKRRIKAKDVS